MSLRFCLDLQAQKGVVTPLELLSQTELLRGSFRGAISCVAYFTSIEDVRTVLNGGASSFSASSSSSRERW